MQTKIQIIELQKNDVLERKMYSSDTVGKGMLTAAFGSTGICEGK
jgi:hypothetical protein